MTTIAWDGKTLATDSLVTADGTAFGTTQKIFRLNDGRYVALLGRVSLYQPVVDFLNGGKMPEKGPDDVVGALIVGYRKKAMEMDTNFRLLPAGKLWAGGSGGNFALAALHLGRGAYGAVRLACKLDIYSRGPIQHFKIN